MSEVPPQIPHRPAAGESTENEPSYEQARDELIAIVQRLEAGGTSLEESLALWERGEALARICQGWLDGARERLEQVTADDRQNDTTAE